MQLCLVTLLRGDQQAIDPTTIQLRDDQSFTSIIILERIPNDELIILERIPRVVIKIRCRPVHLSG